MKLAKRMIGFSAIALAIASPLVGVQKPASAQSRRTFSINNNADQHIQALYLSRSSSDSWGHSDIESSLHSGNSVRYNLSGECDYDIKVVFADGRSVTQMQIDTCLNNSYSVRVQPQPIEIQPVAAAGPYLVYQQPSTVSESQMQSAGARFYPGHQACSLHYSLCVGYNGVWLSQQSSLTIQPEQAPPQNTQAQPAHQAPPEAVPVDNTPSSDTELYLAYYRECMDRTMYRTLRTGNRAIAHNGYDMGYRFGRKPSDLSDDQMEAAGLRWEWGFQSWVGAQSEVRVSVDG